MKKQSQAGSEQNSRNLSLPEGTTKIRNVSRAMPARSLAVQKYEIAHSLFLKSRIHLYRYFAKKSAISRFRIFYCSKLSRNLYTWMYTFLLGFSSSSRKDNSKRKGPTKLRHSLSSSNIKKASINRLLNELKNFTLYGHNRKTKPHQNEALR